jgi:hypothetical protein
MGKGLGCWLIHLKEKTMYELTEDLIEAINRMVTEVDIVLEDDIYPGLMDAKDILEANLIHALRFEIKEEN